MSKRHSLNALFARKVCSIQTAHRSSLPAQKEESALREPFLETHTIRGRQIQILGMVPRDVNRGEEGEGKWPKL